MLPASGPVRPARSVDPARLQRALEQTVEVRRDEDTQQPALRY